MVAELGRRSAGAALGAVDHDEIRRDARLQDGLDDGHELPWMTDAKFEAHRLAPGEGAQHADELHHLNRRRKSRVARRRNAVLAHRHAAGQRNLPGHLGGRKNPAMTWLGALAELYLDHLDLFQLGPFGKSVGVET